MTTKAPIPTPVLNIPFIISQLVVAKRNMADKSVRITELLNFEVEMILFADILVSISFTNYFRAA